MTAQGTQPDKLKTVEEYLLALHDKFLEARKETTEFINSYMVYCYGFLGLLILLLTGVLSKFNVAGLEVKADSGTYIPEYVVLLTLLTYILIDFHILKLSRLFRTIMRSSTELIQVNPNARVIGVDHMPLLVSGITGIMLAPARPQINWLIKRIAGLPKSAAQHLLDIIIEFQGRHYIRLSWRFTKSFYRMVFPGPNLIIASFEVIVRLVAVIFVILVPILATVSAVLFKKYHLMPYQDLIDYVSRIDIFDQILVVISLFIIAYTIYAWLALCFNYALDAIAGLVKEVADTAEGLRRDLGIPYILDPHEIDQLRKIVQ